MRTLLRGCWNCLRWFGEGIAAELESVGSEWAFAREVRSREPMDDETFWLIDYKKDGISFEIATTVRRIYGEQLGHDYRKLRANDFDPQIWDIDTVELVMEVEEALGIAISDDEAEKTSGSIDSIVRLVARKLEPPKSQLPASRSQGLDSTGNSAPTRDRTPSRRTASSDH